MTNLFRKTGVTVFAAALLLGQAEAVRGVELKLYIWEDYIADEVLADFTRETGIDVTRIYFDSDKTRDEIVASTSGRQFDVVVFDNVAAQIFGKNNHLLAINEGDIANARHVDKRWQESCGNFGIPYFYGTIGLVYNTSSYATAPDSWNDLLRPAGDHQGKVVMLEDMVDTLIPPLILLGHNINTEDEAELRQAYRLLEEQVPAVLNYTYVLSNIKVEEHAKKIDLALAYSGDQYTLNETTGTEDWAFAVPREGTVIWMDCLSVTSWSKHRQEAMRLIDFLTDPRQAARNTEDVYSATPIGAARNYMSQEAANDPELFPPGDLLDSAQHYRILSNDNLRLRGRIIDALLKRHETQ